MADEQEVPDGEGISVNVQNFNSLLRLYNKAKKNNWESFKFKGKEMDTGYASFVLEYMRGVLKNTK